MTDAMKNCTLVTGNGMGQHEIALIMKITFDINSAGKCVVADEQIPLIEDPATYDKCELPEVSPPSWDCDLFAFKPGTDVVVQGQAYSYKKPSPVVEVQVQVEDMVRTIRAYGSRRLDWRGDRGVFTDPLAFESMPIRYDRAYGGYDANMDTSTGEFATMVMAEASPDERWDAGSRQFYPRNPAGCGYIAKLSRQSAEGLRVPNLEYPFDVITPERLAIGTADHWMQAPLPASFDWVDPSWFPRIAYLGLTPEYKLPQEGVREVKQGWATPNLLQHRSVMELGMHPTFQHGASPCLIHKQLAPGSRIRLVNMFSDYPERVLQLSSKMPKVKIHLTQSQILDTSSSLASVAVQADENRVVEVWSARAIVARPYGENELENMKWNIQWS